MRALPRNPEMLLFATIQPIMFVVLFVYVFGGSIDVPGYDNYKQYLLPGIFAQTVLFNSSFTAVGIADDLQKGFIDRLRSLPMYPAAVLIGRTISDVLRNVITFVVMFAVALMVGFRVEGTLAEAALATLLLFGFSYAFCWIQAWIGLSVKSVEAANSAGFVWMFPLTFVSSAFVDPDSMPDWLQPIAEANPFTIVTDATRARTTATIPVRICGWQPRGQSDSPSSLHSWPRVGSTAPRHTGARRSRLVCHLQVDETHRDEVDIDGEHVEITVGSRRRVDAFTFTVDAADRAERLDHAGVEVDAVDAVDRVVGGQPYGAAGDVAALDAVHVRRHRERRQRRPVVTEVVPEQGASSEIHPSSTRCLSRDRR